MSATRFNVLFLCTGNSARSLLAGCALDRWGQGKFTAFTAGSRPKPAPHPMTLRVLSDLNFETDALRSKSWDEFNGADAPRLDFVITVCDNARNESCPVWPGRPLSAHWGVEDPAACAGTESQQYALFKRVYFELEKRIKRLVALPIESLDKASMQEALDEIGRLDAAID